MSQYEQAAGKKQQPEQEKRSSSHTHHGRNCPHCGHANPEGAFFCEECGSPLESRNCPSCGAPLHHPEGDICEKCGAWTLSGVCCICYTPLAPGAAFCLECGNPAGGIPCPSCGHLAFSDYCPQCHTCLTEQAQTLAAELRKDPRNQPYFQACGEHARLDKQIAELEALGAGVSEETPAAAREEESRAVLNNLKALAQRRKARREKETPPPRETPPDPPRESELAVDSGRAEVEARREKLRLLKEQREALREEMKNPPAPPEVFKNSQEVRRYFMAIKPPYYKGWLCNAFSMLHADPIHCERPTDGGRWLSEEEYQSMNWTKGYEY